MKTLLYGSLVLASMALAQGNPYPLYSLMFQYYPPSHQMPPVGQESQRRPSPSGLETASSTRLLPGASTSTMSTAWSTTCWMRPVMRWDFTARKSPSKMIKTAAMATRWCLQMKMIWKCKISPLKSAHQFYFFFRVCGNKRNFLFTSASDFMVEFTSDGKKKGRGAKGCKVTCSKPATTTTTTTTITGGE